MCHEGIGGSAAKEFIFLIAPAVNKILVFKPPHNPGCPKCQDNIVKKHVSVQFVYSTKTFSPTASYIFLIINEHSVRVMKMGVLCRTLTAEQFPDFTSGPRKASNLAPCLNAAVGHFLGTLAV
ncbi:hypothetical protein PoB_005061100 [Plakobranchus ocellatus]|uniref:LITAF domain-containing protein n=1 Tax=Plakobranchus ocellatus TaxID=259542 RepID=A0AAV4BYC2_9GAST|nr:hypothetical protein PoB_005061100 [Plakobranchus ocellatus]